MPHPNRSVRILLTASEAFPALERAFLAAKAEIWASFLVFDLTTRLRSPEALMIGQTWFDLIVHTLDRGVALHFCISDVDPIARPEMHRAATRNLRLFSAAAAMAKPGARLTVVRPRHPAQTGALIRVVLWPYIMGKLWRMARWLNRMDAPERAATLRDMDGAVQNLRQLTDGTVGVRFLSLPSLYPAVHHQKLAVFDRRYLYIGGLDLDERRFDTPAHGREGDQTWHDVQLMIEGPVATEAQQHLETFRDVIERGATPARTRRLLRTMSRPSGHLLHFGPKPLINDLYHAHLVLMRRTSSLIYLESQYFRDQAFAAELARAARANPDLKLILILPAAPDDVAFDGRYGLDSRFGEALQARALRRLRDAFGARLFVGSPAQPRPAIAEGDSDRAKLHGAPLVYVHAKVSIFDNDAAILSSANLNARSFRWDTEAGVYLNSRNDVFELRHRVMAHWLPSDTTSEAYDGSTAVEEWRRIAHRNAALPPSERDGFLLPHDFAAAEAFGRKLPILPEELA